MEYLDRMGIQTRPGTHAVHRLGYYRNKYAIAPEQCPVAVDAEELTITLPILPNMTDEDQDRVVAALIGGLKSSPD